jgi:hypothetical protein
MRARRVMRRRSVARAAVGTAVIAGTAGAVHHHQNKKWAAQDAQQQQQYEQEQYEQEQYAQEVQYEAPVEQAPAPDLTAQLQQLAQLHDSGVLTDEEFAAAKSKLLAG